MTPSLSSPENNWKETDIFFIISGYINGIEKVVLFYMGRVSAERMGPKKAYNGINTWKLVWYCIK